ncbi:MAG: nucleotidyltransferase family protein [Terriglobia bacterium]
MISQIILEHYHAAQAIYLFGAWGTEDEWPGSDVDIAALLPPAQGRRDPNLMLTPCHAALADALRKPVDLVNAREVSTVRRSAKFASTWRSSRRNDRSGSR